MGGSIEVQCVDNYKNGGDWISALFITINSKGIKKITPNFIKSGEETKTGSGNIIQIRPTQADIGKRRKF